MSSSKTITQNDLENILNAVLPQSGGGGLLVSVTRSGSVYTCDKTAGEIKDVLDAGGSVVVKEINGTVTGYSIINSFTYNSSNQSISMKVSGMVYTFTCTGLSSYPSYTSGGGND